MKTIHISAIIGFCFLLFASCTPQLTYFTQKLYDENNWTEAQLKRIQFYLSHNLVLKRQLSGGSTEILAGKIKIEDGRQIEEIVIQKGTPGILMFSPKENRFAISFEEGGEKKFLMFGPNPKKGGRYLLLGSEWNRRNGKVNYDGKTYRVEIIDQLAGIMVDLKKIRKVEVNTRTAKGRRID